MTAQIENTTTTTYNGWTNYATWRVNLEIVDEYVQVLVDDQVQFSGNAALADHLAAYCEEIIDEQSRDLANGYATAFIGMVNWHELAETHRYDTPSLVV